MLTNRYGRSFQWGKSLSKDFKSLILDELTDCYGGNKDTMFIKYVPSVKLLKNSK